MVNPEKHLHRLRTQGFSKARPGRIHFRCPGCGRKQSNAKRGEYDPKNAFLAEMCCDNCCNGHKDCAVYYFTKRGTMIDDSRLW